MIASRNAASAFRQQQLTCQSFLFHLKKKLQLNFLALEKNRVYGRRILVLNSSETSLWNPNSITPHSLPNSRQTTFIPCSLKTQNDDGFHGFGSSFRGFCGSLNPPISEEDDENDDDDCLDGESDEEEDAKDFVSPNKTPLWKIVFNTQDYDVRAALDKWLEDGNAIIQEEYERTMRGLFNRNLFKLASNVSSWMLNQVSSDIDDCYYAIHLECILHSQNAVAAQQYFRRVPVDKRGVKVYRALLKSCLVKNDIMKAELCFRKLKELNSELKIGDYNTMLLVYCLYERRKIPKFLESMRDSNLKPNVATYKNLVKARQLGNDTNRMIELVEKMRTEGLEPDSTILSILAKQCIKSSMVGKAEEALLELENIYDQKKDNRQIRSRIVRDLLWNYASLKKEADVERHWKEIESAANTPLRESLMGVLAWGRLGKIDRAEEIFESLLKSQQNLRVSCYNVLLQVYAEHGLQAKADALLKQMSEQGIKMNRHIRGTLIRLYLNIGDLERAESLLSNDYGDTKIKPTFPSFLLVLRAFAERGDIDNAEKIFSRMRQMGYKRRYGMYVSLLQAYIKANVRVHGFKERLIADEFVPDRTLQNLIQQASGR